ncbi:MAG: DNA-3-methyladenine glycosylase 2 family protein [Deltaproteobacteria bacterium]|nr:DNA-3-methyladenine glycosylase 2 family protein [Deltaproteobacteria bacterium]
MNKKTLRELSAADKWMAKLIKDVGPFTLKPDFKLHPYHALIESVVYQQLTGKAAATIFARVKALFPNKKIPKPELILKTPDEKFRSAGLSGAKTAAIKDIAQKTLDGIVPSSKMIEKMHETEILERLTQIRGVGPWTVEMLLIFKLGRPDILPSTDYGVRKGFSIVYKKKDLPKPKDLHAFGERWKPHRTTAAWYLWRAIDLEKAKIKQPTKKPAVKKLAKKK